MQAALVVGATRDLFEVEADRVAEQVIARLGRRSDDETADRRPAADAPSGRRAAPAAQLSRIQRSTTALPTVGVEGGAIDDALASRIQRPRGAGRALPNNLRSSMEDAFGAELGAVRIHAGPEATALNHELGARAFTVGSDIFFGEQQFQPGTRVGQRLLAHELAHTLQQGGSTRRTSDEPVRRNGDAAAGARAQAAQAAA
ncbi:MAG TPA: DUF4157 domain-containing protein, partial [Acidimicrobiia bacterium]|nr:DUF4157 domain-containing protein [Acidimicrobiia bacterium]